MNATECIRGRRSIRQFQAQPVDHALLAEIVETASYAPSWKHSQIARYIAVEGARKDEMAEACTKAWPNNGKIIASAPMLIAVTIVKNRSGFERDGSFSTPREGGWEMFDAGVAAQTFCLAAYEKGLGSVIMGIFDAEKAAQMLNVPEDRDVIALIPIGYPDETPAAPRRKPVEDLLSYQ